MTCLALTMKKAKITHLDREIVKVGEGREAGDDPEIAG